MEYHQHKGIKMLPQFFVDKIPVSLKDDTKKVLKKYLDAPNSKDKIILVGVPFVVDKLMNIVLTLSTEELNKGDWWIMGFDPCAEIGMKTPDHSGLLEYAASMVEKIYEEYHGNN